jgi:hypothetical protein
MRAGRASLSEHRPLCRFRRGNIPGNFILNSLCSGELRAFAFFGNYLVAKLESAENANIESG